ncbi:MAG TPA: hypothetical protein VLN74_13790 [Ilumatobacteraceae bacterium]|nr:hypothetical protein [Ilumatobacteraceae bacterium]
MPSGPTFFDDEDGSQPDRAPTHPDRPELDDRHASDSSRRTRGPNFLIRRAVVVGGVVAVIATASIVVGQLVGSGSDQSASGAIGTDWNRVVLVDDRTGRVIVDDENGEELARIESGIRNPTASAVVDSTLLVAGADSVAVIDVGDGDVTDVEFGAETIGTPAGSALTMVAPRPDGARALLVHGPSGDVIDTDEFAPVVGARYEFADARSAPSGRHVLVTDSGNFQSVLLSFDRDQPSYFPGLALAVDAELVVTAQNIGSDATISVFDHSGEPLSTGRTASVRAGMIAGSEVRLVTVDGAVVTMSSNGETSDDAQLDIGTIESGVVATSGDRLIVTGSAGTAIVDETGAVIASFDAQRPAFDGSSPAGSSCLAMVGTDTDTNTDTDTDTEQIALIDLTEGSVLVEATGTEPLLADAAGCVVAATTTSGFDVLTRDGVRQFRTDDLVLAVSLDGEVVATERDARLILLSTLPGEAPSDDDDDEQEEEEPIDLGPRGRTVHFTQS